MAIYSTPVNDGTLENYMTAIRTAEYGKDARSPMAQALMRCYNLAIVKAGGPQNGVTTNAVNTHANRIRNAVFGEEVRDALKMGLQLVYSARGITPSSSANNVFTRLIEAQTGEELKNGILESIAVCCREVNR